MRDIQKYLDILNENINQVSYHYSFYFNKGRYDWNFYVKLPDNKKSTIKQAAKLCRNLTNGKLISVNEFDEEDLDDFDINPSEHEFMSPYLYDEGT